MTDAMGFAGLLLAYAILRTRAGSWPDPAVRFDLSLAGAMTFVLLFSGATITAAVAAARDGKVGAARLLTALTALAGLAFVVGQAAEFYALSTARHLGLTADHASALFYVITGYHGLHVLVGVAVLLVVATRRAATVGVVEVVSLYWQFVDVVWIVIFAALYLLPPVVRG